MPEPVVVLLTVNQHETDAVLDAFLGQGIEPKRKTRDSVTYFDLGSFAGQRIIHVIAEMGAGGLGASQDRTGDAVKSWKPAAVIAVGIAFGIDEEKQKIGDVLVSKQIQDYEPGRINPDGTVTPRGSKVDAGAALLSRIKTVNSAKRRSVTNWPAVREGLVLSGEKLVDNLPFREALKKTFPGTIGGEMEASGVYVAAHKAKVDWIIVKAICDWGHGKDNPNKEAWQITASRNAATVVKAALEDGCPVGGKKSPRDKSPATRALSETPKSLPKPAETVPPAPSPLPQHVCFFHPATNDSRYALRGKELAWLDECAKSESTRIAAITGQGGLGKTSLAGHWIENCAGWRHRGFQGVFFFSFYSERDPAIFFAAFLEFACKLKGWDLSRDKRPLHTLAAGVCTNYPFLIVLDGLEVLQHGEDDPAHYGWINHGDLNEFVARVGRTGKSLLVLTSRFPFSEIARECPGAMCPLELPLFTDAEGASLLESLFAEDGRRYEAVSREAWSHQLGGHPLALRLFAGACLEQPFSTPEEVITHITAPQEIAGLADPDEPGLSADEQQKRRQRRQFYRLLGWYQQKLSAPKRRLLQLVALFRDPVSTATLIALATGLDDMQADFAGIGAAGIRPLLDSLARQSLLQEESAGVTLASSNPDQSHWTAHPIVRDVFREAALAGGKSLASQFAAIVGGKSGDARPRTPAETLPVIAAIEVLLAAGDFEAADALFRGRFNNGAQIRFIPAPQEGLRCARAFLKSQERRTALEQALGPRKLAFYLNEVALCSTILGDIKDLEANYSEITTINHLDADWVNVSIDLQNMADVLILNGRLREALICATEALFYVGLSEPQLAFNSVVCRPQHSLSSSEIHTQRHPPLGPPPFVPS